MKFKNLNEDQRLSQSLIDYFNYIVDNLGEKKAEQEIRKNLPFLIKSFIFILKTWKRNFPVLDAIKHGISDRIEINDYNLWTEVFNNVCRQNNLAIFIKAPGKGLTESSFDVDNVLEAWDFLLNNIDGKLISRTLISGMQLQEPTMAMFLEQVYNEMPTGEFLKFFREFISENPDEMVWTVAWMLKKFKLEKEYKQFIGEL